MLTAIGRLPTNLEAAFMWRYITLMMPGLCGLAYAVEGWTSARGPKGRLGFGVAWLVLAGVVWSNFTPENYAATVARGKRLWVANYLETHDLNAANQAADFSIYFSRADFAPHRRKTPLAGAAPPLLLPNIARQEVSGRPTGVGQPDDNVY
jgi:hypothetical protein